MCLAILRLPGGSLDREAFECAWENNCDGGGYGYALDSQLFIFRHKKKWQFWNAINAAQTGPARNVPMIIHFRYATHGSKGKENVHPFFVNDDLIMCHNGVIPIKSDDKDYKERSDTVIFNDMILRSLPNNFWKNYGTMFLIKMAVGDDKLIFLHSSGQYVIVNEDGGHWNDDNTIWYSNYSYKYVSQYWGSLGRSTHWRGHSSYIDDDNDYGDCIDRAIDKTMIKCWSCNIEFNWYLSDMSKDFSMYEDDDNEEIFLCNDCYPDYKDLFKNELKREEIDATPDCLRANGDSKLLLP